MVYERLICVNEGNATRPGTVAGTIGILAETDKTTTVHPLIECVRAVSRNRISTVYCINPSLAKVTAR
jgi:hypothetical protein